MSVDVLALAAALASEAVAVECERVDAVVPTIDVRSYLHAKQLEVFECDAPAINLLGGRQGGKTFLDVGWLIEGGLEKPGSTNPYFGLTGTSVRDIMWPEVVAWWKLLGFPLDGLHPHTYIAKMPNGSVIHAMGTDDRRTIETKRGAKYNRIVIDEMGAQPEMFIRYFIDILWPTMIKNRGRMMRSGNPGLVLSGYWYEQTGPERVATTPMFHFTAWDNPHLGTRDEVDAFVDAQIHDACGLSLNEIRRQIDDGVTDGPAITYQREWLALWRADAGALVYPFSIDLNQVDALPTHASTGLMLDANLWVRTLAADCGFVDATSFVAWAKHPWMPYNYCIHAERHFGMLSNQFRERMRELRAELKITRVPRVDMGGLGKPYGEDCLRHGVAVQMAEKADKPALIRLVRDCILSGANKYVKDKCVPLLEEMGRLGWDRKRLSHREGTPDDVCDAANYGWRDLLNFTKAEKEPEPVLGTQEWEAAFRAEHRRQSVARHEAQSRRSPWG